MKYLQSYSINATFTNNEQAKRFHNKFTFSPTTHASIEVHDNVVKIDNVDTGESIREDYEYTKSLIQEMEGEYSSHLVEIDL